MNWYRIIGYTGLKNDRKYYAIDVEALTRVEALEIVYELWHDFEEDNRYFKHPSIKMIRGDEPILYYEFTIVEPYETKNGFQTKLAV